MLFEELDFRVMRLGSCVATQKQNAKVFNKNVRCVQNQIYVYAGEGQQQFNRPAERTEHLRENQKCNLR
jgi:hypothetical protein